MNENICTSECVRLVRSDFHCEACGHKWTEEGSEKRTIENGLISIAGISGTTGHCPRCDASPDRLIGETELLEGCACDAPWIDNQDIN
jgi:hypothetical protein